MNNQKSVILMIFLLVFSLFLISGIVVADDDGDSDSDEDSDFEEEDLIEEAQDLISDNKNANVFRISKGNGWMTNNEVGHIVEGLWATQFGVNINSSKDIIDRKRIRASGRVHVSDIGWYKLIKVNNSDEDTVIFDVIPIKTDISDAEDIESNSIGELELTKTLEFNTFVKWDGTMTLNSGDAEGTWDIELATVTHTARGKKIEQIAKKGIWQRIAFWKRAKEKVKSTE